MTHMRTLCLLLAAAPALAVAQSALVSRPDDLHVVTVSSGVQLRKLTGRSAAAGSKTDQASVALLPPGAGTRERMELQQGGQRIIFRPQGTRRGVDWQPLSASSARLVHPDFAQRHPFDSCEQT